MKSFHLFMSVVIAFFVVGIGCRAGVEQTENPQGTLPIVKERNSLTAAALLVCWILSYNATENAMTQWLEQQTNIHPEWIVTSQKDFFRKLEILLASRTYPGIIFNPPLSKEQLTASASKGKILPLNKYIEKFGGKH